MSVFSETVTPVFARSLTSDLAVVVGSLDTLRTSFRSKVLVIFGFLLLPDKFCMIPPSLNFLIIPLMAVLET